MTLEEFLNRGNKWPSNHWVQHPDFDGLYVRSSPIVVRIDDKGHRCSDVIQIAAVEALRPGNGAFTRLVDHLVEEDLAIFVESVHNERFQNKLLRMGFVRLQSDPLQHNYLFNYEDKLEPL